MKYQSGEKVLCFHGPQIYEAKVSVLPSDCLWQLEQPIKGLVILTNHVLIILQVEDTSTELEGKKGSHYRIHYSGWSKKSAHPP